MTINQLREQLTLPGSGRLIILSAPSGAGKNTIAQLVLEAEQGHMVESVSCTTRSARLGEVEGKDYHFLSRVEFEGQQQAGKFLEANSFSGNLYGTLIDPLLGPLMAGHDILLVVEVEGAHEICAKVPEALTFFIVPAGQTADEQINQLRRQLKERQKVTREQDDSIESRLQIARIELGHAGAYQYRITNQPGNPRAAVDEFLHVLRSTRSAAA